MDTPPLTSATHPPSPVARLTVSVTGAPGTGVLELSEGLRARLGAAVSIVVGSPEALVPSATSQIPAAAPGPSAVAITLLTGLDRDCPPSARAQQEAADARLRADLVSAGRDYRVVYGTTDEQRLAHALRAIRIFTDGMGTSDTAGGRTAPSNDAPMRAQSRRRAWTCEKCSDPECEHKLFTSLVGRTAPPEAAPA